MEIKRFFTREKITNGLRNFGKLRIRLSHESLLTFSALALILFVSFAIRLFPIRWELGGSQVHITEFDGYFQFRFTQFLLNNGPISWAWPSQWVDYQRWYPGGINVALAGYPGLPMTAAFLYSIISSLGVSVDPMTFAAILAPFFGVLASLVIFFLGKDIGGKAVGLFAAIFVALSPSFIQRSSVGWFDDEIIGIPFILLFILLFLRSIETDRSTKSSMSYALAGGAVLGYVISGWGASYFAVGLATLFVFVLIVLKRYSQRLLLSYSLTFGLSMFIAINVPKLSPNYLISSAVLPVAGVFILLCLSEMLRTFTSAKSKIVLTGAVLAILIAGFAIVAQLGYLQSIAGKFLSILDPFLRAGSPLIESVAEHRISAWGSIYYEFGIGIVFFIAGLFFVLRDLNNKNLFILIFGLTSLYFACSMVRLFVLLAPAFGLLGAAGIVGILKPFVALLKETPRITIRRKYAMPHVGREFSGVAVFMIFIVLMTSFAFPMPKVYRQVYTPTTISAGSLPIAPIRQVSEWLNMLAWTQANLESTTVVDGWWDYGYWLTVLGNVTTLADNATVNTTQIQNVGFSFMGNETQSLKMLKQYNAEYILVFATFDTGGNWQDGGGGDNGKWTWMARISGQARQRYIDTGYIDEAHAWTDEKAFGEYNSTAGKWIWNSTGLQTTFYKLMSYGKDQWCQLNEVADPDAANVVAPTYFIPAFFSMPSVDDAKSYYGNLVPLVALYKIDWASYNAKYGS